MSGKVAKEGGGWSCAQWQTISGDLSETVASLKSSEVLPLTSIKPGHYSWCQFPALSDSWGDLEQVIWFPLTSVYPCAKLGQCLSCSTSQGLLQVIIQQGLSTQNPYPFIHIDSSFVFSLTFVLCMWIIGCTCGRNTHIYLDTTCTPPPPPQKISYPKQGCMC